MNMFEVLGVNIGLNWIKLNKIELPDAYTNISLKTSLTVVINYIHIMLYDCLNDFKLHNDINKCEPSAIA